MEDKLILKENVENHLASSSRSASISLSSNIDEENVLKEAKQNSNECKDKAGGRVHLKPLSNSDFVHVQPSCPSPRKRMARKGKGKLYEKFKLEMASQNKIMNEALYHYNKYSFQSKSSKHDSKRTARSRTSQYNRSRIAYNVFNMDKKVGEIAKLPLIIGGFFELG